MLTGEYYQTVTLHLVEFGKAGEWVLKERILGAVPMSEKKTGENIKEKSRQRLQVFVP